MESDSICDQHSMTALMFDRKQGTELKQQVTFPSQKHTDAHLMQHFHFDPWDQELNLEIGQVLQLQANWREFCLLRTAMYNLHGENKRRPKKKKKPSWVQKKMTNSFCLSWKSIQFTNENINKNNIQTTVWFFGKQKKIWKHFSSQSQKERLQDFKKEKKKILLRSDNKKLKPHMAIGLFETRAAGWAGGGYSALCS